MFFRIILLIGFFFNSSISAFPWLSLFDKTATIAHWVLLMTPMIAFAGNQISVNNALRKFPDASSEINQFIKEELKKSNCSEDFVNNIQVKIGERFAAGFILDGKSIITIPYEFQNVQNWSVEQKNVITVLARHEAAHLEHKDMWRMFLASLLSPFLAHYFVKGILYSIKYLLRIKISSPTLLGSLFKIPSAFLKITLIVPSVLFFSKYKEWSADQAAAQNISNPEILRSVAKIQREIYEQYEHDRKLNPQERGTWRRFLYDEFHTPDLFHPNYLVRAKIFEDAANKLEGNERSGIIL